jgi:hypothetical protein
MSPFVRLRHTQWWSVVSSARQTGRPGPSDPTDRLTGPASPPLFARFDTCEPCVFAARRPLRVEAAIFFRRHQAVARPWPCYTSRNTDFRSTRL